MIAIECDCDSHRIALLRGCLADGNIIGAKQLENADGILKIDHTILIDIADYIRVRNG